MLAGRHKNLQQELELTSQQLEEVTNINQDLNRKLRYRFFLRARIENVSNINQDLNVKLR